MGSSRGETCLLFTHYLLPVSRRFRRRISLIFWEEEEDHIVSTEPEQDHPSSFPLKKQNKKNSSPP